MVKREVGFTFGNKKGNINNEKTQDRYNILLFRYQPGLPGMIWCVGTAISSRREEEEEEASHGSLTNTSVFPR